MRRDFKNIGLIAIIVAGVAGYAWHAWDTGLIPGNPRAPIRENFERSIAAALRDAVPEPMLCQSLGLSGVRGEENHSRGAQNNPSQGIFGVTLVPELGGGEVQRSIAMLHALAKSGYFAEADTTFVDASGTTRAAKRFDMTLTGWYNIGPTQCLQLGQRAFAGITKTAKLETNDGTVAYEIAYRMKLQQLPDWAQTEHAEAIFRQLSQLTDPLERVAKLVRTNSGWEARLAKPQQPGMGGAAPPQFMESASQAKTPNPPTLAEAAKTFAAGVYTSGSANLACLMLPSTPYVADEIGDVRNVDRAKPYFVTYYDDPAKNPAMLKQRSDGLALMRALQSIGMVEEEIASDMSINGRRYSGGAVFRLKQKYKVLLDPRTPGCLPIAGMTPEIKAMRVSNVNTNGVGDWSYSVQVLGVAKVADVQPWVTETGADKKLEFVKAILEQGLPVSGTMSYGSRYRQANVQGYIARPAYASSEKPEALFASLTRFYPPGQAGNAAGGNEAHAILVYQGSGAIATPGRPSTEGVILVSVGKTAGPVELFLSAYDPVLWKLTVEPGARLKRVVAFGYYPQRVAGAPPGVRVENDNAGRIHLSYNDPRSAAGQLRMLTAAGIKSIQTTYTGVQFGVGQTRHPILPTAANSGSYAPQPPSDVYQPGRIVGGSAGAGRIVLGGPGSARYSGAGPLPSIRRTPSRRLSIVKCGDKSIVCSAQSTSIMCNGRPVPCQ